jgi:cardiolipin synthase (CMP-forming)
MATGNGTPTAGSANRPARRANVTVPMADTDRILTLPNLFTATRLACVPVFVVLLAAPHRQYWWQAAVLLAVLGATDWIDGQLARRLHQVSTVGKVLDPTADRVLIAVAAIGIVAVGAVPVWVAAVALTREALVAAGVLVLAAAGARRIDVVGVGKAGTFLLMCAMPLFLAGHAPIGWHQTAETLAWVTVVPGLILGWVAVFRYARLARTALAERRESS